MTDRRRSLLPTAAEVSGVSSRVLLVRDARAAVLTAPLVTSFRIATGQHDTMENVYLRIELEDGSVGWGEAGVATHITGETVKGTARNLSQAARSLIGCDIADYRECCLRFQDRFKSNPAGRAAFEMAVLDAFARACGFPFWRLFGSRPTPCRTDITVVLGSAREAASMTRRFYRRGFRAFKIKLGTVDEGVDVARVKAVYRHAPGAALLLDANQAFDAAGMLRFLKVLRRFGIEPTLLEQPVPREDWEGLARLTRESGVPVCADESVRSLGDAVRAVRSKAVSTINVKFAKSGVLQALDIARVARAAGYRLMMGAMLESAVSITAAAQFAAGFGGFQHVDLDTTYFLRGPLAHSPYLDEQGRFDFRKAGAGIGVEPVASQLAGATFGLRRVANPA